MTKYTEELASEICSSLADGMSLKKICEMDGMPRKTTVYKWLSEMPSFAEMYARAREDQADTLADEIVAIADEGLNDTQIDEETGKRIIDHDVIARSRLRVDARKWVAAKLKPRKYGDSSSLELTGKNGGPVDASITVKFVE